MLLIPVFLGCDAEDDLGVNYPLATGAEVRYVEYDLSASVMYFDSLRVDGDNRIIVGDLTTDYGRVYGEGYFRYGYNSTNSTLPTGATQREDDEDTPNYDETAPADTLKFDSLVLEVEVIEHPDPSGTFSFGIYNLLDSIPAVSPLLNNLNLIENQLKGSKTGSLKEILNDTGAVVVNVDSSSRKWIRIPFDQQIGEDFFTLVSETYRDSTVSLFTYQFEDLALVPAADNQAIFNLSTSSSYSRIALYMSHLNNSDDDSVYSAFFPLAGLESSYITRDFTGTEFETASPFEDVILASQELIVDPLLGVTTAFNVSDSLQLFSEENDQILMAAATIMLDLDNTSVRDTLSRLNLYFRKQNGTFFGPATSINQFSNIVMSDNSYLTGTPSGIVTGLSGEKDQLIVTPTLFFQNLYQTYKESDSLAYTNFDEKRILISDLILISPVDLTLNRTRIKPASFKLGIYYSIAN